jgi:tRNA (mo5U34)-methyltransferase
VPFWFHSIDLGGGEVTRGHKSKEFLERELASLRLPPLAGKSVLDVGAWDGYYSFAAERMGAERVVALDSFVWRRDLSAGPWESKRVSMGLPGRRGFDLARRRLGSRVVPVVAEVDEIDAARLGTFDVVLFLGVLYHMTDPLGSLRRIRAVCDGLAIVETHARVVAGNDGAPLAEFVEDDRIGDDPGNWWVPTAEAAAAMCRAAGFSRAEIVQGPPEDLGAAWPYYRAVLHAYG